MAEAVLFDLASGILAKLGARGAQEIGLWWNMKDELEKLRSTVSTIQAVLLDAEENYYSKESNEVRVWVDKLRETFYDADDLLDDFSTMALRRQLRSGNRFVNKVTKFISSSNSIAYGLKMGRKIKSIRDRLDEIAAERKFHLVERPMETSLAAAQGRDQTHSSLPEVIVGRNDDKKKIIELLFSSDYEDNVVVIPIIGIGGLGKTTLAQLVYNDEEVKKQFELRLWVCVSDNFDVKLIAEKIIESATREKPKDVEMNTTKDILHENINSKKFLLVLDDVWNDNMEKWSRLKTLLVGGARGSRIVITSRLRRVAEITSTVPPYELQGLLENESWSLFIQMAFKRGQGPQTLDHEMTGKEIVKKCKGVPLAIKTIGRLLFFKDPELEWLSFKDEELSKVSQNEDDILPTLKLSYNLLPAHLKHCFAYCRLFPKDEFIEVKNLIDLWRAQGYIINTSDSVLSSKDIGMSYCKDLLSRSFLEIDRRDALGDIINIKLHDLMHDLATSVAGPTSITVSISNSIDIDNKTRHVSFLFDDYPFSWWHAASSLSKASKLRTILSPRGVRRPQIGEEQCHAIFNNCKRLRVLDLNRLGVKIVPRSVAKLQHLRYLDLSFNGGLEIIPNSVSKLLNLEVLILFFCTRLQRLPRDINKLVNLRRLDLRSCHRLTRMPSGIGRLTKLQELSKFVVGKDKSSCALGELRGLNCLGGSLRIENLQYVKKSASEFKDANLKMKKHIEELTFSWTDGDDPKLKNAVDGDEEALEELQPHKNLRKLHIEGYRGLTFPSWISSLSNLKSIRITYCQRFTHLPRLHDLPSLIELTIEGSSDMEYIQSNELNVSSGSRLFKSLKYIRLNNCPKLKGWWPASSTTEEKSLPEFHCLFELEVIDCPVLTLIPLFPPLQSLMLKNTSTELLLQIFKIQQQSRFVSPYQKVENVLPVPEEPLRNLNSLNRFGIFGSWGVEILSQASRKQHLTSLEILHIWDCEEPELSSASQIQDDGIFWEDLHCLCSLNISNFSNLVSLPLGIQYLTNLVNLEIKRCPNLLSLPKSMRNLTLLRLLYIVGCPHLFTRCGNKTSEDWHLIAHIPNIVIDGLEIQKFGHYKL